MTNRQKNRREAATKTMFKVPNTPEGQKFLNQMRKYATGGTRTWARGRGPRARHSRARYGEHYGRGFDQQLPQELAEYLAVYVWKDSYRTITRKELAGLYQHYSEAQHLQKQVGTMAPEIQRLDNDRKELMKQRDMLQQECQRLRESRNQMLETIEKLRQEARSDSSNPATINLYINTLKVGEC